METKPKGLKPNNSSIFQPAEKSAAKPKSISSYYSYAFAITAIIDIASYAIGKIINPSENKTNQYQP